MSRISLRFEIRSQMDFELFSELVIWSACDRGYSAAELTPSVCGLLKLPVCRSEDVGLNYAGAIIAHASSVRKSDFGSGDKLEFLTVEMDGLNLGRGEMDGKLALVHSIRASRVKPRV